VSCLDETTTLDFIEGGLSKEGEARVKAHIDTCDDCRALASDFFEPDECCE
jgi:predicted anti-sigma-YlaC factor YlaD